MKLIEQNVELIKQEPGIEGIYKQIEVAARLCYKSEDKITEDSAKKFVDMLIKNEHGAMLEHGTVYLKLPVTGEYFKVWTRYSNNKYTGVTKLTKYNTECFITTNYRVLVENGWLDDLKYLCEPTEFHKKRYSLKFTTSIGITRELTRHRVFSFACESTRYVNYRNRGLEFVKSYWYDKFNEPCDKNGYRKIGTSDMFTIRDFESYLQNAEYNYLAAINAGAKPQEAREMLPLCTKSEIIMTGFESDWENFFKLRCDKTAHPDMQIIANKSKRTFKSLKNE